ncbi:MAG: stage 0 sporulation family protein [Clostridia bacterium]|nr:stage 0 sporulation family protein [Clostridia bacterium]
MAMTVGVRFRTNGKIYDFDPGNLLLLPGEKVIVETARGTECGEVARANRETDTPAEVLKPVLRRANEEDLRRLEELAAKTRHAMQVCQERIAAHGLDMKLVEAEYAFDNSKITFDFTAEGRVDFRNLVKDLAGLFHTRIELHQIGVRDEAKKLGGIGICGQPFCCSRFLKDFQPVSIKMAKEQGLSLNPTKISGSCGRLMCCLKYEQDVYEELLKLSPKVGATVMTPEGRGVVTESNVLTGKLKVRLDKAPDSPAVDMMREDVSAVIRDNRPKNKPAEGEGEIPAEAETPAVTPPPVPAAPAAENKGGKSDHRPRRNRPRNKRQG